MSKKKAFAAVAVALSMAVASGCTPDSTQANKDSDPVSSDITPQKNADGNYNILFVTTDQERYFDQYPEDSQYQARKLLEEMGTTFEKHYVCTNMSTSSRSVMYTGTHITETEMLDNTDFPWQGGLSADKVTIGDRLREAGLYTAYKGKWHMADTSILFEEEPVTIDLEQHGFSDWNSDKDYVGEAHEGYEIDPVIVSDSVDWLKTTGSELNENGQSFFLAVNLINPHDVMNLATDDEFVAKVLDVAEPPEDEVYEKTYDTPLPSTWQQDVSSDGTVYGVNAYKTNWTRNMGGIDDDSFKKLQDYYFNCIQDSDNNLMNLLNGLKDEGMLNNTIIVFTSDHGEMQGAHGLKGKGGFVYDYNVHVPLIIYHPDYEGGRRIDAVTSHLDLAPTFIDMTFISDEKKAEISAGLQGKSLMDLMDGSSDSIRDGALFCYEMLSVSLEMTNKNGKLEISIDNRCFVRAIITEDYKFARYFSPMNFNTPQTFEELISNNDIELYDIKNDPEECNNLALNPEENKALIMEMNTQLNELIAMEIGVDDGSETASTMVDIDEKLMMFAQKVNG